MAVKAIAALWGFAEATLFFIVPDLWLSFAGRHRLQSGLIACLFSLGGALLGGIGLYFWGQYDLNTAQNILAKVPAIGTAMIESVALALHEQGVLALFLGPLSGTPYKLYAIEAATAGVSFWAFMLVSIPARLIRFVCVVLLSHYGLRLLYRLGYSGSRTGLLLLCWSGFYLFYFSQMGFLTA